MDIWDPPIFANMSLWFSWEFFVCLSITLFFDNQKQTQGYVKYRIRCNKKLLLRPPNSFIFFIGYSKYYSSWTWWCIWFCKCWRGLIDMTYLSSIYLQTNVNLNDLTGWSRNSSKGEKGDQWRREAWRSWFRGQQKEVCDKLTRYHRIHRAVLNLPTFHVYVQATAGYIWLSYLLWELQRRRDQHHYVLQNLR
jgi:hypothetical protein